MVAIYDKAGYGLEGSSTLYDLGDVVQGDNDKMYIYVSSASALTAGDIVTYNPLTFAVTACTTTASLYGTPVGVVVTTCAAGDRIFLQIKGACSINVAASCAANVRLNTTATAGRIDDDGTAGAKILHGVALTTANGGSAAVVAAVITYPAIAATI